MNDRSGENREHDLPLLQGLGSLWDRVREHWLELVVMVAIWAILFLAATLVAADNWRDDVPRSTIGAVWVGLCVLTALALFGVPGSKSLLAVVAAIGALAAVGGGAVEVEGFFPSGPPSDGDLVDCPPEPPAGVPNGFVAATDLGYVHLRTEPNLGSHVLLRYPPGCNLRIVHACVGEPKVHWRFRDPDPVWFWAEGDFHDGYIAAADVRAGPGPRSVPLRSCPGGRAAPTRAEVTAPLDRRLSGPIEIAAAAPRATEVGFAAYYRDDPDDPGSATWHQIGVDTAVNDGATASWDTRSVPGQSTPEAAAISLAAVPCLGLEFPLLSGARTRDYVVANRGGGLVTPLKRPEDWRDTVGTVACDNAQR